MDMMKIQRRQVKKPNFNSKRIYHYTRENIAIIKKYHLISSAFHNKDLTQTVWVENGSLMIKLTPKKENLIVNQESTESSQLQKANNNQPAKSEDEQVRLG